MARLGYDPWARGPKTFRFQRYSDSCGGALTVHIESGPGSSSDYRECDPKAPVRFTIKRGRKTLWAPSSPLCLGPMHDPHTAAGRREAADAAVDFFEHHRCGAGALDGARRGRSRGRR